MSCLQWRTPCDKPPLQIQRANVKSRRRSPGVNAPNEAPEVAPQQPQQPQQAARDTPEGSAGTRKSGSAPNQRSAISRRNYGNCISQLKCKQCQIAVISHSYDSHSFNAKYLISGGYLIVHGLLVFLVVPVEIEVAALHSGRAADLGIPAAHCSPMISS
jgi:hypothetical protein